MEIQQLKQHMYDVVGAIHEVHRELGPGLTEYCYQEGFEMELKERNIPYCRELTFHPNYHEKQMESTFRVDFLCKKGIVVECKAVSTLTENHRAQLFNYMRLLDVPCGILVNFSPKFATIERYFYDKNSKKIITTEGNPIN
jgi:GxxExxY protein